MSNNFTAEPNENIVRKNINELVISSQVQYVYLLSEIFIRNKSLITVT